MSTHRLALYALNGSTPIVADLPWRELSYSKVLNAPGGLEATFWTGGAGVTMANLVPGARELRVYEDEVLDWAGYLWSWETDPAPMTQEVRIRGQGFYSRLRRWVVLENMSFVDQAAHEIAWDLIASLSGEPYGDMGFTQGSHSGPSTLRTRTYCEGDHAVIADLIEELAGMDDGFDFEISDNKAFNTWSPRRGSASGLTLPPSAYQLMRVEEDATGVVSRLITVGDDECARLTDDRWDTAALSTYGLLMDVEDADASTIEDVEDHAASTLALRRLPRWQAEVTYLASNSPGVYGLGDTLTLTSSRGFATFSKTVRLVQREKLVQPGPDGDIVFIRELLDGSG